MPGPNSYDETEFPHEHRPNLTCEDPRGTARPTNDFVIQGSIDNETYFDAGQGRSVPSQH